MEINHPPIKILHLEDSQDDAILINTLLSKSPLKYEMRVVDTRPAFIRELWNFMPDVILSDHSLPGFNSLEALAIIQYAELKIPFILVTGQPSKGYVRRLTEAGMDDYILKDHPARLPEAIINVLKVSA
jgi:CheY-like chemotaxis protein